MTQDEKKTILEETKENLNALEDELSIISLQHNLPASEQVYLGDLISKMRTNLEILTEEEKRWENKKKKASPKRFVFS